MRWVKRLQLGDREAFQAMVQETKTDLFRLVFRIIRNQQDAEDVLQEVYLKVYRNVSNFRQGSHFKTWLYRIAVNACLDKKRQFPLEGDMFQDTQDDDFEGNLTSTNPSTDPEQRISSREIREKIAEAMDSLTPLERAIFTLRHEGFLKLREIADTLECDIGTVKNIHFRAIRKLRHYLSPAFSTSSRKTS